MPHTAYGWHANPSKSYILCRQSWKDFSACNLLLLQLKSHKLDRFYSAQWRVNDTLHHTLSFHSHWPPKFCRITIDGCVKHHKKKPHHLINAYKLRLAIRSRKFINQISRHLIRSYIIRIRISCPFVCVRVNWEYRELPFSAEYTAFFLTLLVNARNMGINYIFIKKN